MKITKPIRRPVKPFSFKDLTKEEMVNKLNTDNPISLKYNQELINRVYERYPDVSKIEIARICLAVFQSIRDLLVLGKVVCLNNLFFDMKFCFYDYRRDGHILPALKVQISTPPKLRKNVNK